MVSLHIRINEWLLEPRPDGNRPINEWKLSTELIVRDLPDLATNVSRLDTGRLAELLCLAMPLPVWVLAELMEEVPPDMNALLRSVYLQSPSSSRVSVSPWRRESS